MSDYDPESELRRLCDTAGEGKAVHVSPELWKVLEHAQHVSQQSGGTFDVTVGPVVRLWRRARRQKELPSPEALRQARDLVGYQFVRLDAGRQTVELLKKGMRLDLGGIAKGYAMDEALAVLQRHGITRALVEAGGDMRLGDPPPGRAGWRVGIPPLDNPQGEPLSYLELARVAVSTSGDIDSVCRDRRQALFARRRSADRHGPDRSLPRDGRRLPPAWPPTPSPRPSACSARRRG